jgi:hypothetical protein
MAISPEERDRNMTRTGKRLALIGAVVAAIGIAIAIPLEDTASGIGWAVAFLGALPLIAGLGLIGSAVVSRRSRAGKPFA